MKKKKRGQPSKYDGIDLDHVRKMAELGFTDKQMAYSLGISEASLNNYKKKPEFFESLKAGKITSDGEVVRSLFERATGYTHESEEIFCDSKTGAVTRVPTLKRYPPDPTSMIFWLKNRDPKNWKETQNIEHSGNAEKPVVIIDAGSNPYVKPKAE